MLEGANTNHLGCQLGYVQLLSCCCVYFPVLLRLGCPVLDKPGLVVKPNLEDGNAIVQQGHACLPRIMF